MIPAMVTIFGICAIVVSLYVLKQTGTAVWNRKMREAMKEDIKSFGSDDTIE
jgi:hypothetical protein